MPSAQYLMTGNQRADEHADEQCAERDDDGVAEALQHQLPILRFNERLVQLLQPSAEKSHRDASSLRYRPEAELLTLIAFCLQCYEFAGDV